MINDDIIIKTLRGRGHITDWIKPARYMRNRLYEVKLGFPGLKNDHLSLIEFKDLQEGDLFIYDPYIENGGEEGDIAPKMFRILRGGKWQIEGIGTGLDLADPDRQKWKWKDVVEPTEFLIPLNHLCLKVEVRPGLNGGPGYYYFFKSYHDFRM